MFATASGNLLEEDIKPGVATVLQNPHFPALRRFLLDYSAATSISFKVDTVKALATNQIFTPGCRRAFLAASDLAFGMGRMYQIYSEDSGTGEVEVFRDRSAAIARLNEGVPTEKWLT